MSRIGKLPVPVPDGVTVSMLDGTFSAKGPKGEHAHQMPNRVVVSIEEGSVVVAREDDSRESRAMHGLARSLVRNVVQGVSEGFSKTLDINGVGYRVQQKKEYLVFTLGYSHGIYYEIPEGLEVKVASPTQLILTSVDKQLLGQSAAEIRAFRPPEPYKGKGIKYSDEVIRRKEGKSGAR